MEAHTYEDGTRHLERLAGEALHAPLCTLLAVAAWTEANEANEQKGERTSLFELCGSATKCLLGNTPGSSAPGGGPSPQAAQRCAARSQRSPRSAPGPASPRDGSRQHDGSTTAARRQREKKPMINLEAANFNGAR